MLEFLLDNSNGFKLLLDIDLQQAILTALTPCAIIAWVIRDFANQETESLFHRGVVKRIPRPVRRRALRKLLMLDAAESLDDLRVPPGNRLEKLRGDREGQYSIRINNQWRICFRWEDADARDVEIADYH